MLFQNFSRDLVSVRVLALKKIKNLFRSIRGGIRHIPVTILRDQMQPLVIVVKHQRKCAKVGGLDNFFRLVAAEVTRAHFELRIKLREHIIKYSLEDFAYASAQRGRIFRDSL